MRIVLYCDDPGLGGTAVNAALLACSLSAAGFPTVLACGETAEAFSVPGVRCIPLGYDAERLRFKARFSRNEPERIFWAERPDLVFFCDGSPASSLAAKAVCRAWGIPYVVLVNYVAPTVASDIENDRDAVFAANAAALAVVAVSGENLGLLRAHCGVPAASSGVIYNGRPRAFFEPVPAARREAFRRALGLGPQALLCLTVARYEPRKGYRHLLEVAAALASHPAGAQLYYAWIGHDVAGGRENLEREVARQGLSSRILVAGQRDDVRDWLAAADLFVLPSESEGMPLCIIEAMGQGLPIVATAVSGVPEQLGDAGILLPDPTRSREAMLAALFDALARLVADPPLRRSLGNAGRERALSLFTAEAMLAGYIGLLESLRPAVAASRPRYPEPASFRFANHVPYGQDIRLGEDAVAAEYLKNGWSHAEGEGRWTDGERAEVVLSLPAGSREGYVLTIEAKPFLGRGQNRLEVVVSFCGRELGRLHWPPLCDSLDRYAWAYLPEGPLPARGELVFWVHGATSPASLGLSDDARLLGLWLTRMRLDRLCAASGGQGEPF
jgi:glycosyltransferase involved in cell wall biosynthesis